MKRLLFICGFVFLASAAQAQTPVGLAPVPRPVFTQNGAPLVNGCLFSFAAGTSTPLATFADSSGTVSNPNPTILDANGTPSVSGNEVGIYLSGANYKFQLKAFGGTNCASGASVWTADNINAASFLNLPNSWTQTQSFNAGAGNSDIVAGNLNGIRIVDGVKFTTPQAAINDCPATDCWVLVKPGTYTVPNNLNRSHLHLSCYTSGIPTATITAATNLVWNTPPADNKCIFTNTANLTLSSMWNTTIEGITFDFGSGNFGIVINGTFFNNTLNVGIQNSGTGTALALNTGAGASQSTVGNTFNLNIFNAGRGIIFNGTTPNAVGNNRFGYVLINNISIRAVEFIQNADTNLFDWLFIAGLSNTAQAIAFNTSSAAVDTDCDDNVIKHLITDVFNPNSYTGTLIQINKSFGNAILAWSIGGGVTVGGGTELAVSNSPGYSITYLSDFSLPGNNNTAIIGGNIYLNGVLRNYAGTSTMGITAKKGSGAGNYTTASTTLVVVDSTNLCNTVTIPLGWKLLVQAGGSANTATASVQMNIAVTDNASCATANSGVLNSVSVISPSITVGASWSIPPTVINGDGASHNIALQFSTTNVADSATISNPGSTLAPMMTFTLMPSN